MSIPYVPEILLLGTYPREKIRGGPQPPWSIVQMEKLGETYISIKRTDALQWFLNTHSQMQWRGGMLLAQYGVSKTSL